LGLNLKVSYFYYYFKVLKFIELANETIKIQQEDHLPQASDRKETSQV